MMLAACQNDLIWQAQIWTANSLGADITDGAEVVVSAVATLQSIAVAEGDTPATVTVEAAKKPKDPNAAQRAKSYRGR